MGVQPLVEIPLCIIGFIGILYLLYEGQSFLIPLAFSIFFFYILRAIARGLEYLIGLCIRRCCPGRLGGQTSQPVEDELQKTTKEEEEAPILPKEAKYHEVELGPLSDQEEGGLGTPADEVQAAISPFCPAWLLTILSLFLAIGVVFFVTNNTIASVKTFQNQLGTAPYIKRTEEVTTGLQELEETMAGWLQLDTNNTATQLLDRIKTETLNHAMDIAKVMSGGIIGIVLWLSFFICLLPSAWQKTRNRLRQKVDQCIEDYIFRKSLIAASGAILMFIVLNILQVPLAFAIAFLCFFLNFIPEFGIIILFVLLLVPILLCPDWSVGRRVVAIIVPMIVNFGIGRLEAFAFVDDLHPIIVLLSLLFWQKLWDIWGMMLAVPITSVVKIVLTHINHPYTNFLAHLLGGHFGED